MDTNTAISTLLSMQATLQSNITGFQAQSDAITVALGILQGTLTTQLDSLTPAETTALESSAQSASPNT